MCAHRTEVMPSRDTTVSHLPTHNNSSEESRLNSKCSKATFHNFWGTKRTPLSKSFAFVLFFLHVSHGENTGRYFRSLPSFLCDSAFPSFHSAHTFNIKSLLEPCQCCRLPAHISVDANHWLPLRNPEAMLHVADHFA